MPTIKKYLGIREKTIVIIVCTHGDENKLYDANNESVTKSVFEHELIGRLGDNGLHKIVSLIHCCRGEQHHVDTNDKFAAFAQFYKTPLYLPILRNPMPVTSLPWALVLYLVPHGVSVKRANYQGRWIHLSLATIRQLLNYILMNNTPKVYLQHLVLIRDFGSSEMGLVIDGNKVSAVITV